VKMVVTGLYLLFFASNCYLGYKFSCFSSLGCIWIKKKLNLKGRSYELDTWMT